MQVAVTDMAEDNRPRRRLQLLQPLGTALQEDLHAPDRHRDIVLDTRALVFLCLRNRMADTPEALCLGDILRNHGIDHQAVLKCVAEQPLEQILVIADGDFRQDEPVPRRLER